MDNDPISQKKATATTKPEASSIHEGGGKILPGSNWWPAKLWAIGLPDVFHRIDLYIPYPIHIPYPRSCICLVCQNSLSCHTMPFINLFNSIFVLSTLRQNPYSIISNCKLSEWLLPQWHRMTMMQFLTGVSGHYHGTNNNNASKNGNISFKTLTHWLPEKSLLLW